MVDLSYRHFAMESIPDPLDIYIYRIFEVVNALIITSKQASCYKNKVKRESKAKVELKVVATIGFQNREGKTCSYLVLHRHGISEVYQ